ncbi:MAG: DNA polymerase III subunit gamma/tau, partial [Burkholderiales bacterium]|nr:DNA polymerase III subunit gamma/tau [Burkholderiales bacterium]
EALEEGLPERERVAALAKALDPETVQLCYQIALQGREDLPLAPDEHAGFLMTLLRMLVFRPGDLSSSPGKSIAAKEIPKSFDGNWAALVQRLPLSGGAKELGRNSELRGHADGAFELVVQKAMGHLAGEGFREKLQAALTAHFGSPAKVRVTIGETHGATAAALESAEKGARRAEAVRAVQGDDFVQELVNLFDGRVVDSTIREKQR